jgi:hypothetical protein
MAIFGQFLFIITNAVCTGYINNIESEHLHIEISTLKSDSAFQCNKESFKCN